MANTLSAKEVATKLETDARTLRKFLRSDAKSKGGKVGEDTPGKGGRYSFTAAEVKSLRKKFSAWEKANAARKAEKETDEDEVEVSEVEGEVEEVTDEELSE